MGLAIHCRAKTVTCVTIRASGFLDRVLIGRAVEMNGQVRTAVNTEVKVIPSSGNVFADLGFAPAAAQAMAMQGDLMIALEKAIRSPGLAHRAAPQR
jgi:hypothetical protein